MVQTYHGFTGVFQSPNEEYWTDTEFKDVFDDLCDRQGYPPVVPRLAIQTYPRLFCKLKEFEEPRAVPMPKAMPRSARKEKMEHDAPDASEVPVSEAESEWGPWHKMDPSTQTVKEDDAVADPAGGPQGAPPVGEATSAAPRSWKDNRPETWESTIALVDLGERETAFLSQPELLLDKANELFGQARQTAGGKDVVDWPLPQINADGSEFVEDAKTFRRSCLESRRISDLWRQ